MSRKVCFEYILGIIIWIWHFSCISLNSYHHLNWLFFILCRKLCNIFCSFSQILFFHHFLFLRFTFYISKESSSPFDFSWASSLFFCEFLYGEKFQDFSLKIFHGKSFRFTFVLFLFLSFKLFIMKMGIKCKI